MKHLDYHLENVSPILRVADMKNSLAFYVDVLGFENAPWGDDTFTCVAKDQRGLYLCQGGQGVPGTWVWMGFGGDIHDLHKQLLSKGVKIKLPPTNYSWACEMQILDPDGHVLRFGTDPSVTEPFADRS